MRVALVGCSKQKAGCVSSAETLYTSPLFRAAKEVAMRDYDRWYILSAKHGLIEPSALVEPYDTNLSELSRANRKLWSDKVASQFECMVREPSYVDLFAGKTYAVDLVEQFSERGHLVCNPLGKRNMGQRVKFLKQLLSCSRFRADSCLQDQRKSGFLKDCRDLRGVDLPRSGVYLFIDDVDCRGISGNGRVVRVGTHGVSIGSKSTLWERVKAHLGTERGGNHRSSIFRLHVGNALIRKYRLSVPTWGVGSYHTGPVPVEEAELEVRVSRYMRQLKICFFEASEVSSAKANRAVIEKSLIGLFASAKSMRTDEEEWLGNWSPRGEIRESGLWNIKDLRFAETASAHQLFAFLSEHPRGLTLTGGQLLSYFGIEAPGTGSLFD